ncbi:MAG: hypothetical protein V3V04_04020 [Rhizobiaceae bacterium]
MRTIQMLFIFLFAITIQQVSAADWGTYSNPRYGFQVDYPLDIFDTTKQADNGDGVIMETFDGAIEFRAYGFMNGDELPLKQVQKIILEDSDGRDVTYKRNKGNWIVISGYEMEEGRRMIFYQRLAASADLKKFSAFEFIYPESDRAIYDPMLKHLSLSLTAPK